MESVIQEAVEAIVSESHSLRESRIPLTNKLVEALELDSSWVEIYGLSGELNVPGQLPDAGPLAEPLAKLKAVRILLCADSLLIT